MELPDAALAGEPWVSLPNGNALKEWNKEDEVIYNQIERQVEKLKFFRFTIDYLKDNRIHGDYHEYGCHRCRTFRMALTEAHRRNMDFMSFYAFDSFEGLPAVDDTGIEIWTPGALTTSEDSFRQLVSEHGIYTERVHTIKGFYDQSLNDQRKAEFANRPLALVNIDCDLYESAVPVFDFIEPLLQPGAVIYLDDLFAGYKGQPNKGVLRAWIEYQGRSRFKFIRHMDIGWWGRSYIVCDGDIPSNVVI